LGGSCVRLVYTIEGSTNGRRDGGCSRGRRNVRLVSMRRIWRQEEHVTPTICQTPRGRAQDTSADVGSFEAEAARNARLHALCSRLMRFMRAGALEQEAEIERERARRYLEAADEKAVEKSARRDARRKTARLVFLRMSLNSALNRRACDVRVFPCLLNCQFKKIRGH
jgi:hypothetical protein